MTVTAIKHDRLADCTAPKTSLTGYKIHGCRCPGCTKASTDYNNRRDRLIAYGRWQHMTDAEPVRQHIRNLMANGIGWQRVAQEAGVSTGGVSRILYGSSQRPPCKRVKQATAQAILAVQPRPDLLAPGTTIDATGTRRRTQALAALGWSISEQARRLDRTVQNHKYVLTVGQVTVRTAKAVASLYDELSSTTPPPSTVATRTRRWAKRNGWAPPLAWDDETIGDPKTQPAGLITGATPEPDDGHDETTVQLACDGRLTHAQIAAHQPDLVETVRRLARRMGDQQIADHLRWPGADDVIGVNDRRTRGQAAVCHLRKRESIPGPSPVRAVCPRIRTKAA